MTKETNSERHLKVRIPKLGQTESMDKMKSKALEL